MLALVDQFLGMFSADPQLEGLELHPDTALKEHLVGIAGAVANAEKERPGLESLLADSDCAEIAFIEDEVVHPRIEAELDTKVLHSPAHSHQNGP